MCFCLLICNCNCFLFFLLFCQFKALDKRKHTCCIAFFICILLDKNEMIFFPPMHPSIHASIEPSIHPSILSLPDFRLSTCRQNRSSFGSTKRLILIMINKKRMMVLSCFVRLFPCSLVFWLS